MDTESLVLLPPSSPIVQRSDYEKEKRRGNTWICRWPTGLLITGIDEADAGISGGSDPAVQALQVQ
jgi:hypothetical protein